MSAQVLGEDNKPWASSVRGQESDVAENGTSFQSQVFQSSEIRGVIVHSQSDSRSSAGRERLSTDFCKITFLEVEAVCGLSLAF